MSLRGVRNFRGSGVRRLQAGGRVCLSSEPPVQPVRRRLHSVSSEPSVGLSGCARSCHLSPLATFVWFFSTVHFQVSPQSTCIRGHIITQAAVVQLDAIVCLSH